MQTIDKAIIDSCGAFLESQLTKRDPEMHKPLMATTWSRDIPVRNDIDISDVSTSFDTMNVAVVGGGKSRGKAWATSFQTDTPAVQLAYGQTINPLTLWALKADFNVIDLQRAMQAGRDISSDKTDAIHMKHELDIDEMVYIGDKRLGYKGMLNHGSVKTLDTVAAVADMTNIEVLDALNNILLKAYDNAGAAVAPDTLLLPSDVFGKLACRYVDGTAETLLSAFAKNNMATAIHGKALSIRAIKYGNKSVSGLSKSRGIAYTQDRSYIRFPMTQLRRTPLESRGLTQETTYYGTLGVVEIPMPETVGYVDFSA